MVAVLRKWMRGFGRMKAWCCEIGIELGAEDKGFGLKDFVVPGI